jgi:predicted nucleic acid-binding protein
MGLRVIGTAGILLLARQRGMAVDVRALLDAMRAKGFRLGNDVYADILRQAAALGVPAGPPDSGR